MTEPTVAEETFAKMIAFWHGQKPSHRNSDGVLVTVATRGLREPRGWAHETDTYVEKHWREYIDAARAVLEARS